VELELAIRYLPERSPCPVNRVLDPAAAVYPPEQFFNSQSQIRLGGLPSGACTLLASREGYFWAA
jgi:hypothetical protein